MRNSYQPKDAFEDMFQDAPSGVEPGPYSGAPQDVYSSAPWGYAPLYVPPAAYAPYEYHGAEYPPVYGPVPYPGVYALYVYPETHMPPLYGPYPVYGAPPVYEAPAYGASNDQMPGGIQGAGLPHAARPADKAPGFKSAAASGKAAMPAPQPGFISRPVSGGAEESQDKKPEKTRQPWSGGRKAAFILSLLVFMASLAFLVSLIVPRVQSYIEYRQIQQLAGGGSLPQGIDPQGEGGGLAVRPISQEALNELARQNGDFTGWLYFPGTRIAYPMVQTTDNDFYLTHTFKKAQNACGSIYLDEDNAGDFSDANTVIYGHNMIDGSMFHDMAKLLDKTYFQEHPFVYITTPDGHTHQYRIFSAYLTDAAADYRTMHIEEGDERIGYFDSLHARSVVTPDVRFAPESKIVTFSTCPSNGDANLRIAVHALYEGIVENDSLTVPDASE